MHSWAGGAGQTERTQLGRQSRTDQEDTAGLAGGEGQTGRTQLGWQAEWDRPRAYQATGAQS